MVQYPEICHVCIVGVLKLFVVSALTTSYGIIMKFHA
jgi:hypothetical protein